MASVLSSGVEKIGEGEGILENHLKVTKNTFALRSAAVGMPKGSRFSAKQRASDHDHRYGMPLSVSSQRVGCLDSG